MMRTRFISGAVLVVLLGTTVARTAPDIAPAPRPMGYRTVEQAIRANLKEFRTNSRSVSGTTGYLGVVLTDKAGKPVIEAIAPDSPAEQAGLKEGDVIDKLGDTDITFVDEARYVLSGSSAGDKLTIAITRDGKSMSLTATLVATSNPIDPDGGGRAILGVQLGQNARDGGVTLDSVTAGRPAEKAGLKARDVIIKADGKDIDDVNTLREILGDKEPGDRIDLIVMRGEKKLELTVIMGSDTTQRGGFGGWDTRIRRAWRKPTYKLAIVGIEYPDVKHNERIKDSDWEESMFSIGTYNERSATGDRVYGSMNDYYQELSAGTFKVEGSFVGWVEVSKNREDYSTGSGTSSREKRALLTEALDVYTKKHGKSALKEYDGIFFLYAGGRVRTTRGGLYWPHRANIFYDGRSLPYFIVQEGGRRMNDISVFCHEFGHMLGLPDLYARPEQPGSEGVGVWCAMSNQLGGGRPQHFSAWCKEQLEWVKPVVIDPRVKQKLILSPIEGDPTQCYKVMVRSDGSEYFLLENRRKQGWDDRLPGEGLLIWRVVNNKPILEESHGIEGPRGPGSNRDRVPFPSASNDSFTPYTIPSSKGQLGGGLPVWITNIRKLPDGRITFHIGYEYQ